MTAVFLSFILLIDEPQTLHKQVLVVNDLVSAVAHNDRRVTACSYNCGLSVRDCVNNSVNNAIEHSGG